MAATIVFLLLAALMARVASAGVYTGSYAGGSAGSYTGGSVGAGNFGFSNPTFINPIKLPQVPGLPSPPPLPWPSNFPFPNFSQVSNFPQAPNFPQPQFPNLQPITGLNGASQSPESSVLLTSHHTFVRGEDGKIDKTGESTLVLNRNGEVTVHKIGDAQPDTRYIQYKIPSFADFQQPEFKQQNFKRSNLDFPTMEPFSFEPIKMNSIKDIRPGSNEQFQGQSFTYSSYYNEVNGEKDSGGEASFITNNNGDVQEEKYFF